MSITATVRRFSIASLATLLATALVASAAPIRAGAQVRKAAAGRIEVQGRSFDYRSIRGLSKVRFADKEIVRKSFRVPMSTQDQGMDVELYVEVVRPKKMKRYPVVLELSPYHGTLANRSGDRILPGPRKAKKPHYVDTADNDKTLGLAGFFAPRGYAVVFADLRGTGKSGGCLDHLGPKDQADSKELVDWIAKQPWSNGRVGMTGHSYVGSTPQMTAAQKPKALKTIVPSAGLAAMYHHKFQDGVPYLAQWVGPAAAYEQLSIQRYLLPQLGDAYGDSFGENLEWFGCGAPNSALVSGDEFEAGAYDDEEPLPWDAERDFRRGVSRSKIPVFAVHGVNDNAARIPALDWFHWRTFRWFDRVGKGHVRRKDKAWIGQWDHGSDYGPNTRTCAQHSALLPCKNDQWSFALLAWFDKHLKQKKIRTGPPVEVFLNNGTVYQAPSWPPVGVNRRLKLFLTPENQLSKAPAEADGSLTYVADGKGEVNDYNTDNELGTNALGWTTPKFTRDTLITGIPKIDLYASQTVSRMHIIATLYDMNPDGTVNCVEFRTGAERCSISKATFAFNPELREGIKELTPVVPGEKMKLTFRGMAQAYVIPKGHTLRLVIASSHTDKVATHAEGSVTVYMGPEDRSRIAIPIIKSPTLRRDPFKDGFSG